MVLSWHSGAATTSRCVTLIHTPTRFMFLIYTSTGMDSIHDLSSDGSDYDTAAADADEWVEADINLEEGDDETGNKQQEKPDRANPFTAPTFHA